MVAGLGEWQPGRLSQLIDDRRSEAFRSVDAGTHRGPTQRQLRHSREGRLEAFDPIAHLSGIPAELLAEGHRGGVHEMGAPGLHNRCELARLPLQGGRQAPQRRNEDVDHAVRRGQVDG